MKDKIHLGDSLAILKQLPDESVNCVVTSPPYWALRDYGVPGQIGLETTFGEYISKLCDIFDEVKRVLRKDGTCWVNIGDTYGGTGDKGKHKDPKYKNGRNGQAINRTATQKSLCQIPSRFAIEMTNRGWILRNEIIWHKPNAMPSSAKDRFTVDFEKVFFFTKSKDYFFEQQLEKYTSPINRWGGESVKKYKGKFSDVGGEKFNSPRARSTRPNYPERERTLRPQDGKNKRTVWSINTKPFKDAHFAVYPEKLIEPMIKAGCPDGGVVLDPFFGAGTTGVVAKKQGKYYIGIELNTEYIKIAEKRLLNIVGK